MLNKPIHPMSVLSIAVSVLQEVLKYHTAAGHDHESELLIKSLCASLLTLLIHEMEADDGR